MRIADLGVALLGFRCGVDFNYASLGLVVRLDLDDSDRPAAPAEESGVE